MVLGAAAIGAGVLALAGDDEDGDDPASTAELAQQQADEVEGLLSGKTSNGDAGIVVRYPADWKGSKSGEVVNVESPDRCIVIRVSAPVQAGLASRLAGDIGDSVAAQFGKAREEKLERSEIDNLPTEGALLAVESKRGTPVVLRQTVSKGKRFAYLTQTLYRAPPCAESSPTADLIVQNLELSK